MHIKEDIILSVREIQPQDIPPVVDYFVTADDNFLRNMGADRTRLPSRSDWIRLIADELDKPPREQAHYYLIWLVNDLPVGHSNINKIKFGDSAAMHLHLWPQGERQKGLGLKFITLCIPYFFKRFQLKKLICEPFAHNPAPNKTLRRYGFQLAGSYEGVPGWISYHQQVNLFELTREKFEVIHHAQ